MRRAGNARVVGPDEHFQFLADRVFALVNYFRYQLFKILLDIGVILIGRDAHIGGDAVAVFVEFVFMEQYSARSFEAAAPLPALGFTVTFSCFMPFVSSLSIIAIACLRRRARFGELRNCVHVWIAAAFFQSEGICATSLRRPKAIPRCC